MLSTTSFVLLRVGPDVLQSALVYSVMIVVQTISVIGGLGRDMHAGCQACGAPDERLMTQGP